MVEAQSGKSIPEDEAEALIAVAQAIIGALQGVQRPRVERPARVGGAL